jgi:23S rRNA pseudouridine2457 synthase
MVSQFVSSHRVRLLGDIDFVFPEGTHAIGRLDSNSEGLLVLTTNKKVTKLLFESGTPHRRIYLVQVKKTVTEECAERLRTGVSIRVKGGGDYTTTPCEVVILDEPEIFERPGRSGKIYGPYTWLQLTLTEGKFRQIRKMVDAVGHQCIRLIRVAIEDLQLGSLQPGGVKEFAEDELFQLLKIEPA